jgi:hypothetical protein
MAACPQGGCPVLCEAALLGFGACVASLPRRRLNVARFNGDIVGFDHIHSGAMQENLAATLSPAANRLVGLE